jgi:hypothetical protein
MKSKTTIRLLPAALALGVLSACSGIPVALGSHQDGPPPAGAARQINAESCGFQLFSFIPIGVNGRAAQAYADLEVAAAGDFITDVKVQETWTYAFVGTSYCTKLQAKAIRRST